MKNLILNTDSYKMSHYLQYPDGTTNVFSYVSSRGGKFDKTVFFGLQAAIKEYLMGQVITQEAIDEAEEFANMHGEPFNREGWEYILKVHKGRLPLRIRAVPEGTVVPVKKAMVTVEATDPNCFWLTSYVESVILRGVWYPTTVATLSRECKRIINYYLENTADTTDGLSFKLHDFGSRGVSSEESAALGGMAHLVNFMGSDTISGILAARKYYGAKMAGFSIPAAEHSTTTILGPDGETEQFRRMIQKFGKPGAIFAVVSDGYDIYKACEKWGTVLKDDLIASGATLVVRPDSGDPVEVTVKCLRILEKYFGAVRNSKGFKVLNNVRLIYGDGINELAIESILRTMELNRYSADNMAFGMGGGLLQQIDRDTLKFAMKASAAEIGGKWVDVFKDPVTDKGKSSLKGRMSTFRSRLTGEFIAARIDQGSLDDEWEDMMEVVFENGEILKRYTFDEVRANAAL